MKRIICLFLSIMMASSFVTAYGYDESRSMVKIRGTYGASFGITAEEFLWKEANGDWQEKNWRYISGDLDENTYDPRIFDRYQLEIETDTNTPFNAYTEIVMDPWSFTGIGSETVYNAWGDRVDVKYKYWENTGKTINETFRTYNGNFISTSEQKVIQNKVTADRVNSGLIWQPGNPPPPFFLSTNRSVEIDSFFRPVRRLWVEYNEEPVYIKVFPIADQREALTTDDPLHLSNNHVYWAPSPWLFSYDPGMRLSVGVQDAKWNWDLAWFAEDSNRRYLTYLRGITLGYECKDVATIDATVAAPMTPWQYYGEVDNVPAAIRLKFFPFENLQVGSTYTARMGFDKKILRAANQALGFDVAYRWFPRMDLYGQYVGTYNAIEHPNELEHANYVHQENWDHGGKFGMKTSFDMTDNYRFKYDTYFAFMGRDFLAALADYKDTRADREWGRHIWFDPISVEDEEIRIGNGIDINRYVFGFNFRANIIQRLFDLYVNFRNVHASDTSDFVENVFRLEGVSNPVPNLQLKGLFLNRVYPDSIGDFDPIFRDRYRDEFLRNYMVLDGQEVVVNTFSTGAKLDMLDGKLSVYGIYEATNDPQDFPRGILNSVAYSTLVTTETVAQDFNRLINQVYNQNIFDLPPYEYYNIWKAVVTIKPTEDLRIRYEHVTNGNRNYAALYDNNHTHDSIEVSQKVLKNVTIDAGYSRSKIINLRRAIDTNAVDMQYEPHHNIYAQMRVNFKKGQRLVLQFGEAWIQQERPGVYDLRWPSTRTSVLDTRSIFRVFFEGKF
ncbi:MAG: hypothetical protein HQ579_02840 [Candidatus Omnitrophica bacterium]|nr:hypothetical protein [Candidatus Omnitrophota bacterium]